MSNLAKSAPRGRLVEGLGEMRLSLRLGLREMRLGLRCAGGRLGFATH
jgi:hypothetical protein